MSAWFGWSCSGPAFGRRGPGHPLNMHFFFTPSSQHSQRIPPPAQPCSHGLCVRCQRNVHAPPWPAPGHQAPAPGQALMEAHGGVCVDRGCWAVPFHHCSCDLRCPSCSCQGQCMIQDPGQDSLSYGRSFLTPAPSTARIEGIRPHCPSVSKHSPLAQCMCVMTCLSPPSPWL